MKNRIFSIIVSILLLTPNSLSVYSEDMSNSETKRIDLLAEEFSQVDLSDYITEDGNYSFRIFSCEKLEVINVPEKVTELEIQGCATLRQINVSSENNTLSSNDGVLFDKSGEILMYFPSSYPNKEYIAPEGVKEIKKGAFTQANISTVKLPDSLITIDSRAFAESKLERVVIPANVRDKCESIFYGCSSLTDVIFYDTSYAPDTFTSFPKEPDYRYSEMFKYSLSPKINLYVPRENVESYKNTVSIWENNRWGEVDKIDFTVIPMNYGYDMKYDTNNDSVIGIADVISLNQFILGKKYDDSISGDLNNDQIIDSFDMIIMRQYFSSQLKK